MRLTAAGGGTRLKRHDQDAGDGRNPRPHHFKTMVETTVCWYLQGNHHSMISQVMQDFVHAQYECLFLRLPGLGLGGRGNKQPMVVEVPTNF